MIAPCPTPNCPSRPALKWAELHGTGVDLVGWQIMCELCGCSGPAIRLSSGHAKTVHARAADRAGPLWNRMSQAGGAC
jgi:hypothetical protein